MKNPESVAGLLSISKLKALLSFGIKGYLTEIGWFNAFRSKSPVGVDGKPIPWVTYSFIDFIADRISKEHRIFEFGSGNSTWYYADRAGKVVSVEHDREWLDKISASAPANSEMIYSALTPDGSYAKMPLGRDEKYHIIIVDGRDRVNCCRHAIDALTVDGVVVLDDSERTKYEPARSLLLEKGFRELSFSGISPGLFYRKSTSVFYKSENCIGI